MAKAKKADPQNLIERAFAGEVPHTDKNVQAAVKAAIAGLDKGELRICTKTAGGWQTNEWLKKAILLYFRITKIGPIKAGQLGFLDKIPVKKWTGKEGVRVVPHAIVRQGSFVAPGAVLMPSYVNIGAYVGEGSMVDTWATVGSCAQVGAGVHISGGVGLGGVLEPVQANPVIIEDHVFLGSRCIVVEGVRVEEGAVIAAGVTLTSSTKIIDVTGAAPKEIKGYVPANSVVIPGTTQKTYPAGTFGVQCALIIGKRTESTDRKTSLNQTLREFDLSV
ncbi:MAG TPA: 2,3,4,5-tetrahydropyridine-2,6-dicarboxylate N-succinyltransferase [Bdellovibrionales bacterium]|nr:2,3,4,5-tetrahydropyridine-2,6-dicarboxylate N-succinyltransferase [Bdellovibrionales bacterium]